MKEKKPHPEFPVEILGLCALYMRHTELYRDHKSGLTVRSLIASAEMLVVCPANWVM